VCPEKGITLIEIIVVIFMVAIFSTMLITDFPKILKQSALSRATYKLGQDLRRAEDLGLSGVVANDKYGTPIKIKGYGFYVSTVDRDKYIIYADVADANGYNDEKYCVAGNCPLCADVQQTLPIYWTNDCVIEIIYINKENPNLIIKNIDGVGGADHTSVNFTPPDPIINIDNLATGRNEVGIILGISGDNTLNRAVYINTSGSVKVQ